MEPKVSLRIAIGASCAPGKDGGVTQAVTSLIQTLGKLEGPEVYTIVVESEKHLEWLRPMTGPNQHFALRPATSSGGSAASLKKRFRTSLAGRARKLLGTNGHGHSTRVEVPFSDGFYESLQCDLIHFPTQRFVVCAMPSIYNPHDLQHLHYPQFFTPSEIAMREAIYQAGCHFAQTVVVGSQWIKDDVINQYRLNPEKVQVIPEHSPTQLSSEVPPESLSEIRERHGLREPFAIYPAVTWPHKNHLGLFEALAYLRDERGLSVPLVCTGARHDSHWPRIEERIKELKLEEQVQFLGFVSDTDLRALYRLAQFLVMPTFFEASSLPIFEAWLEGTPVACSNVTALPDQVRDAALLFEPNDKMSIADSIERMATEAALRDQLRSRAYRRLQDFDWQRTAKAYRAVYRRAARRRLTEEDRWLLSWDWMRNPERNMEVA